MFYLIYISIAVKLQKDEDIALLLEQSRNRNLSLGVTGMLLYIEGDFLHRYAGGRFIQVLEGSEQEVRARFEIIRHDSRHFNVILLSESTTQIRNFGTWSMGFKYLDHQAFIRQEESFDLNDIFKENKKAKQFNVPLQFLKSFYNMNQ